MNAARITSPSNELIKRVRALSQRKRRREEGAFVVEGIRPVWQAVESGASIEVLIVAPDLLNSEAARHMVEEQASSGTRIAWVSTEVFDRIAEREHPSGLAAIVRMPHRDLADLAVPSTAVFAALYQSANPGNLGTIIRTVDAIGGSGLITIGDATDPYHPTAVKASMGTLFRVPVVQASSVDDVLAWCRTHGIAVITTSEHAATPHWSAYYPLPCLVLFGSEGAGLPGDVMDRSHLAVRIPMAGTAGSLNLAVAAGIVLYETRRRDGIAGRDKPQSTAPG